MEHRHPLLPCRLLRVRRERPRRCAAEQLDDLASSHCLFSKAEDRAISACNTTDQIRKLRPAE
jgi:hypothetical protein